MNQNSISDIKRKCEKIWSEYWWMIILGIISLFCIIKFSDAPNLFDDCLYLHILFQKPAPGTIGYDICRALDAIGLSFLASIFFYIMNVVIPERKRKKLTIVQMKNELNIILKNMKYPFVGMADFYGVSKHYSFSKFSFDNSPDEDIKRVFEVVGFDKLGFEVVNYKHVKNIECIFSYINRVNAGIEKVLALYTQITNDKILEILSSIKESEYHKNFVQYYYDPSGSPNISSKEQEELAVEAGKLEGKRKYSAQITIWEMDANWLIDYVHLYRKLKEEIENI